MRYVFEASAQARPQYRELAGPMHTHNQEAVAEVSKMREATCLYYACLYYALFQSCHICMTLMAFPLTWPRKFSFQIL